MTPWVNWQQFADLNEAETQRVMQEREQAQAQQQAQMQAALNKLTSEASEAGKQGGYRGIEGLGSYQQLMELQKQQQAQQTGQPVGAAWDSMIRPDQPYKSPWADLDKRLGVARQAGQTGQTYYKTQRATQAREMDEYNRRKQAEKDRLLAQQKQQAEDTKRSLAEREYEDQKRRYAGKVKGL